MPFEDTTAIVTGGASGLGLAITEALAARGTKVAMFDIQADEIDAEVGTAARGRWHGQRLRRRRLRPGPVEAAVAQVRDELGPVLILVNSAGIEQFGKFAEITDEFWDRVMAVNLRGPFICVQEVLPDMLAAHWGRIVNISSSSAQGGQSRMAAYVSSKAGLIGFTKALALGTRTQGDHRQHHSARHGGDADAGEGDRRGPVHRLAGQFRQDHPGASGGPAGGHRQRRDVPVPRRIILHHWAESSASTEGAEHDWRRKTDRPLLAPLTADEWGDDEYSAFGALLGLPGEQVPRAGSGHAADPLKFDIIGLARTPPEDGPRVPDVQRVAAAARRATRCACAKWRSARRARPPVGILLGRARKVATEGGVPDEDISRLAEGNDGFAGSDLWCSRRPTNCWPTAAPTLRHGNASPKNWARIRRWNSSSSSAPTRCWRWPSARGACPPAGSAPLPEPAP